MDFIQQIRQFMAQENINFLLVNSTNQFLVEYNDLQENSRYKLTGFTGSAGESLVTPDKIFLFVDGRYHIQADLEVDPEKVIVVKLQSGENIYNAIIDKVPQDEILGVFSKKISQKTYEFLSQYRRIKLIQNDPLDVDVADISHGNISLDTTLAGLSTDEKIEIISKNLKPDEALYVTDLDEVSYLFNMRNYSQNFSAKIKAKAIVYKNKATLFLPENLDSLKNFLESADFEICVDKNSINAYDYNLIKKPKELSQNPLKEMKSVKNDVELYHMQEVFHRCDDALCAVRDYIYSQNDLSEYDIAAQLEKEFRNRGALGLSFKPIVAKDQNSALAHYSKSSKGEILKDGSLILIDCGAYFENGIATDMTRVFVKGEPKKLHIKIYTLVLKAFLNAYNYEKRPVVGFDIDERVRELFEEYDTEGFVFNHGLGHGIGINVHEYPPNLGSGEIAKCQILEGMCFSIEPGLYKKGEFGVRLENSCYFKNNKINSFTKMNFEKKLIDFEMLTTKEAQWLKEFEVI